MRLGISYALSYESAEIWADLHRKCDCRTVVFPLDCHSDEKTIEAYAKAACEADLTIAEVGVWRNMLSSDPQVSQEVFDYTVGQIRMADAIGRIGLRDSTLSLIRGENAAVFLGGL